MPLQNTLARTVSEMDNGTLTKGSGVLEEKWFFPTFNLQILKKLETARSPVPHSDFSKQGPVLTKRS